MRHERALDYLARVNVVSLPMAMLWNGHVPGLCVRHGAPATVRMSFRSGTVQNWPFCAECVKSRRVNLGLAIAALAAPFLAIIVGVVLFSDNPQALSTLQDGIWVFLLAGIIMFWFLLFRYVFPSGLAKAKVTGNNMWLVIQGAHPAFVAHANEIVQRTGSAFISPTGQLAQPDRFAPPPENPQ